MYFPSWPGAFPREINEKESERALRGVAFSRGGGGVSSVYDFYEIGDRL